MPQSSLVYAVARTRVLEGKLLTQDRLRRMLDAQSAQDALRALQEMGYGGAQEGDIKQMIDQELSQAYRYVREVTPNVYATGAFLLKGDCYNLKVLFKGKVLGKEVQHMLLDRGTLGIDALLAAVQNQDYAVLPAHLGQVARQLDARIEGGFGNVREIECLLDAACFADMADYARRSGQQVVVQCVQVQADLLNLITLLRIKRSQAGPEQLAGALLPGGSVPHALYLSAMGVSEDALLQHLGLTQYRDALAAGLELYARNGSLSLLERESDDVVTHLLQQRRYERESIAPLIGYLIAKEREAQAVRLVVVAKMNDVPMQMAQERLRDLYA